MIELKNWSFTGRGKYAMLCGNIYGSPKFTDGLWAHTAPVMKFQEEENGFAITAGTVLYHCAFADHQQNTDDLKKWLPMLPGHPFDSYSAKKMQEKISECAENACEEYAKNLTRPSKDDIIIDVDANANGYICSENPEKYGVGFMTYAAHRLEFFHFPEENRKVWVKNVGQEAMEAAGSMGLFLVQPGETLLIDANSPLGRISEHISAGAENAKMENIRNF